VQVVDSARLLGADNARQWGAWRGCPTTSGRRHRGDHLPDTVGIGDCHLEPADELHQARAPASHVTDWHGGQEQLVPTDHYRSAFRHVLP
jgi:hypothetical protein